MGVLVGDTREFVVRLIAQFGLVASGIILFLLTSHQQDALLILIFPFFFGIPALLLIALIFAPFEHALTKSGHRWVCYLAIPAVGAILPLAITRNPPADLWKYSMAWGVLWMLTGSAYDLTRIAVGTVDDDTI